MIEYKIRGKKPDRHFLWNRNSVIIRIQFVFITILLILLTKNYYEHSSALSQNGGDIDIFDDVIEFLQQSHEV